MSLLCTSHHTWAPHIETSRWPHYFWVLQHVKLLKNVQCGWHGTERECGWWVMKGQDKGKLTRWCVIAEINPIGDYRLKDNHNHCLKTNFSHKCCIMWIWTKYQIMTNWNNPYYLLDIFITSLHHRMTHIPSLRICHMLSLPLTSCLSIYIGDKPKSKALRLHSWDLKGRQIEDRKSEGTANTRFR